MFWLLSRRSFLSISHQFPSLSLFEYLSFKYLLSKVREATPDPRDPVNFVAVLKMPFTLCLIKLVVPMYFQ